jgi:Outer membrane protein beta-barrel domain
MNKSKFVALFTVLAGLAAAPAAAQTSFYIGGAGGTARANESICNNAAATYGGTGSAGVTCDRTGKGAWGAFVGLMFNPYLGIEGGAKDLGTIVELADTSGNNLTVKTRLAELNAVAALPVQRLSLYLKGGGYRAKSTVEGTLAPYGYGYTTQWTLGAGVSYDVFKHLGLRAEFQRYNNLGSKEVGFRADVDVGTVGVYLKF